MTERFETEIKTPNKPSKGRRELKSGNDVTCSCNYLGRPHLFLFLTYAVSLLPLVREEAVRDHVGPTFVLESSSAFCTSGDHDVIEHQSISMKGETWCRS